MEFKHNHFDLTMTFKRKLANPTNVINHPVSMLNPQNRILSMVNWCYNNPMAIFCSF